MKSIILVIGLVIALTIMGEVQAQYTNLGVLLNISRYYNVSQYNITYASGGNDTQKIGGQPALYNDSTTIYWNTTYGGQTYYTQIHANATFLKLSSYSPTGNTTNEIRSTVGDHWVNTTGDTMTGNLIVNANVTAQSVLSNEVSINGGLLCITNSSRKSCIAAVKAGGSNTTIRLPFALPSEAGTNYVTIDREGQLSFTVPSEPDPGNAFETINAQLGTDPVADSPYDILNMLSTDGSIDITGTDSTDTLDFEFDPTVSYTFTNTNTFSGSTILSGEVDFTGPETDFVTSIDMNGYSINLNQADTSQTKPRLVAPSNGRLDMGWGGNGGGNFELYSKNYSTREGQFKIIYGGSHNVSQNGDVYYSFYNGTSGTWTTTAKIEENGDMWVLRNVSADGYIDRTPGWGDTPEEALRQLTQTRNAVTTSNRVVINHTSLPAFTRAKTKSIIPNETCLDQCRNNIICREACNDIEIEEEGRSIGATVTMLVEAVKALKEENIIIKEELCLVSRNGYGFCH